MQTSNKKQAIHYKQLAKVYKQCAETQKFIDEFEKKNKVHVDKFVPLDYLELPTKIPNIISISLKNKKRFALENIIKDGGQKSSKKSSNSKSKQKEKEPQVVNTE
ncbi:unnamed protein product [Paramecium pentaurelia]|uniref:Uncharacterized protein n=1 Tax=Paramecium pentaurelia TaxID=43138 RepID=A0A8S1WCX3_9CILI|nr:unnamed protein product [Paramecium pentaurelia]